MSIHTTTDPRTPSTTALPPVQSLPVAAAPVADPTKLSRADLAAMLSAYREAARRPGQWMGFAIGVGALVAAAGMTWVAETLGWPESSGAIILGAGWAVALGSFGVVWKRDAGLRERYQVGCPSCGATLLDETVSRGGIARAELAIATGNCPSCGERIFAD